MPFPLVIFAAALGGLLLHPRWPQLYQPGSRASGQDAQEQGSAIPKAGYPPLSRAFRLFAVFFILWALLYVLYGTVGALATTYATVLPSFFFIFAGAPYIEALTGNRHLQAALTCVIAAVVGVIMNLAVFFGSRVVIRNDGRLDDFALVEALLSFLLIWRFRLPIHIMVAAGGVVGIVWRLWF